MLSHKYDVIIIGGGQAGVPLAHALAQTGLQTLLIERANLGGSCVNFGCTPTKAAITSARVAHQARRAQEFGLRIPQVEVDFPAVLRRAKEIAAESRHGLDEDFADSENPRLLRGQARIIGKDERQELFKVQVGDQVLEAKQIVVNTGTRSLIPKVDGLADVDFIDAGNWLEKSDLPEHLAIMGGSFIGIEMAQFYRRMGSRVTVIESGANIVEREDADVSRAVQTILEKEQIEFRLNAKLTRAESNKTGLTLTFDQAGKSETLAASHLFVAAGRLANTDDLGLETVGVTMDEHGIIKVDERLSSNVAGIWAAGDVRGGYQFTHTAWDDFRILESQMIGDKSRTTKRIVPYAMFTDPQLGRVGLTERAAREQNHDFKISCYDMKKNGKAREIGEPNGFIKVVADAKTEKILGAAVLANEGAELVHLFIDLMNADAPLTVLRDAIHIHPTLAEAVQSSVKEL